MFDFSCFLLLLCRLLFWVVALVIYYSFAPCISLSLGSLQACILECIFCVNYVAYFLFMWIFLNEMFFRSGVYFVMFD